MPELPEVETVRRSLAAQLVGRRLFAVEVSGTRLRKPVEASLACALRGREVTAVERRGKYLLAHLDDGNAWIIHLGMTGCVTISPRPGAPNGHTHLRAVLDDGRELRFLDPRRFGLLFVGRADEVAEIAGLGVEPFSRRFNAEYLRRHCLARKRRIKDLLMDQRIVAGLGNIYVNEILFAAGVRPGRRASSLTRRETQCLVLATRRVLSRALRAGGTSISDFRKTDGSPGKFQHELCVYGREGCRCRRCGGRIRRARSGARSSYYCPGCQR